jgi:hypothetical protein
MDRNCTTCSVSLGMKYVKLDMWTLMCVLLTPHILIDHIITINDLGLTLIKRWITRQPHIASKSSLTASKLTVRSVLTSVSSVMVKYLTPESSACFQPCTPLSAQVVMTVYSIMNRYHSTESSFSSRYWADQEISYYLFGRFVSIISKAYHWVLSWASSILSTSSQPVSLRSISIIFFYASFDYRTLFGIVVIISVSCSWGTILI